MRNSNGPFIPANDYNEINSLLSFAGMNYLFDLHISTHYHSEVHCGYFRRLVFGNSLTFSYIPLCFHDNPPDFPCLIGHRVYVVRLCDDYHSMDSRSHDLQVFSFSIYDHLAGMFSLFLV